MIVKKYSRNQKRKCNVIMLQKSYRQVTVSTTHVLHKSTDRIRSHRTTQNYRLNYTKLCYSDNTTDKLSAHATDTNQVSCTQI